MKYSMDCLDPVSKKRYERKIEVILNKDPYKLNKNELSPNPDCFPKIAWGDLVNYLVFGKSAYTLKEFKAFKSLESYNQFVCKWVREALCTTINGFCVVIGKVLHSQRLSEPPLRPWIISTPEGDIQSAHCSCKAGLGEACSHVGALLFFIEDLVKAVDEKSVTSVPAYWLSPSPLTVKYKEMAEIDFSTPIAKKRCLKKVVKAKVYKEVPKPTDEEYLNLLQQLNDKDCKSAILNVVEPFCNVNPPDRFPLDLTGLYKPEYELLSFSDIQKKSDESMILLMVTEEQVSALERCTRQQSKSGLWHRYRTGRVTASVFKAVCSTRTEKPSISLIKKICYPETVKFTSRATLWGCTHEKEGKQQFLKEVSSKHENFSIEESGLLLNAKFPHLGASPDGIVNFSCCGKGCLEVKCPYCLRDASKEEIASLKSCLETKNDVTFLKRDHSYYYQIQAQIFISESNYCDFVFWTEKTFFTERIFPDMEFWKETLPTANSFFRLVLLPELLGKCFTKPKHDVPETTKKNPIVIHV